MNGASKVFSNADRGAGIYMYYLFDEVALNLPAPDQLRSTAILREQFSKSRDTVLARSTTTPNLATDFIHLLIADDNDEAQYGGESVDSGPLLERGSMVAVSSALLVANAVIKPTPQNPLKGDELLMCYVAHELTHMLIDRRDDPFNPGEHTGDINSDGVDDRDVNGDGVINDADRACIMHQAYTRKRLELATVTLFPMVQRELRVKTNQALK